MSRNLKILSALSLGIGAFLGVNVDRAWKNRKLGDNEVKNLIYHTGLSEAAVRLLPKVAASTLPARPADINASHRSGPGNRVSQIMRYGFPGMDTVRTYDDFVLSYDRKKRLPHWVFEHLTQDRVKRRDDIQRQSSKFQPDDSLHPYFRVQNEDYKGSGYDRGHLAAAANHRWSQTAMDQTFQLSNIAPQVGEGFNRDAWNELEKFVRHLTKRYTNVYVCTGPLFLPRKETNGRLYVKYEVIGKNHVAVPTHFFKAVVMEKEGEMHLLSFVMPNQVLPSKVEVQNYLVPVETIERSAGLLLFDSVPKTQFKTINGKKV